MTTIKAWYLISYLTAVEGVVWRPQDYDNNKMIKCLKDEVIKGTFNVRTSKKNYVFDEQNKESFIAAACAFAAKKMLEIVAGSFCIVPVPNSSATKVANNDFRTFHLAKQIAIHCEGRATVVPVLRWNQPMKSSRTGGTRDPQILSENLTICARANLPIVLFDDVLTTGAHLIACCRKLHAATMSPQFAVVMGRTTHEQHESSRKWREEDILVEERPPLWLDDDF